jgi:RNA polymerase-interacting CarD/CdnL/TRCF family regulator
VSKKPDSLVKGDWVVHAYYGIGKITKVETKAIGDEKARYYRVDAKNSTFYVPVKNVDPERIRPLSSDYKFRKARKILRSDPENLPENHNDRRKFIAEFVSNSEMDVAAGLIRDLTFRKQVHGLNDYEMKVLENTEKMFLREWAIIQDITEEEAFERYQKLFETV